MFFMFFFISFNYTILRDTKDTLVVTSSGAEAIFFLKVYGTVPAAIIFMLVYAKLSNMLSKENLFYVTLVPFLIFFALFAYVIYPNEELLRPVAASAWLIDHLPSGFLGLIKCFENWTFSLFYILAELWGSVVLSLMFWGFANDITRVTEAKRFYSLFGIGANVALLVSGPTIVYFSNIRDKIPTGVDPWQISLNWFMGMIVVGGLAIMAIYWWMNRYVLSDKAFYDPGEEKKLKKSKPKMSIMDSLAYLAKSRYILLIAILVISYGIAINIVEVTWKNQLKLQYPNYNDYQAFMGWFSTGTGLVTVLMMLFVGSNVIRRLGWTFGALFTPVVLLITGLLFFAFILFRDSLGVAIEALGTTPLFLAVVIGAIQNIMSKSTKYSLFDPTKEMAYIPLDQEQKVKGKAAVDVVGARAGKMGGSLLQQGLVFMFGSISAFTPYVAGILMLIIGAWIYAAKALGKEFNDLTNEQHPGDSAGKKDSTGSVLGHS